MIVENGIQYVTESSAVLLIVAAFLVGYFIGIYYERITGK